MTDYSNFPPIGTPVPHTPYALRTDGDTPGRDIATRNWNDYNAAGEPFERVGDPRDMVLAFKGMLDQFRVFFAQGSMSFVSPLIEDFMDDFEAMLRPSADLPPADTPPADTGTVGMTSDGALQIVYAAFDGIKSDGQALTHDDLLAAAEPDSPFSPEVRQAVRFLLSEPNLLRSLDTARQDNVGTDAPLDNAYVREDFLVAMDRNPLSGGDRAALRTIKNNAAELFTDDNLVSRDELKAIVDDGTLPSGATASPGMVDAARRLLDRPALLDRLDSAAAAYRGDAKFVRDGTFSEYEIDLLLKAPLPIAV